MAGGAEHHVKLSFPPRNSGDISESIEAEGCPSTWVRVGFHWTVLRILHGHWGWWISIGSPSFQ